MCRLLGYLGRSIQLDQLLYKPEHSLIVQSYQPREMTSGLLNADGFGIGWHHAQRNATPYTYKNTLPIWSDINLPHLSRYIESKCILANVRSATAGQPVDLSNCQPYSYQQILGIHNGFIRKFRQTLHRAIRDRLDDPIYQGIEGTTDSEHIFALLMQTWQATGSAQLEVALQKTLLTLVELAQHHLTEFSANLIVSDGQRLVASRFAYGSTNPSLYWLRDDPCFPEAVVIASEPLFTANWNLCPERSILSVGEDLEIQIQQF